MGSGDAFQDGQGPPPTLCVKHKYAEADKYKVHTGQPPRPTPQHPLIPFQSEIRHWSPPAPSHASSDSLTICDSCEGEQSLPHIWQSSFKRPKQNQPLRSHPTHPSRCLYAGPSICQVAPDDPPSSPEFKPTTTVTLGCMYTCPLYL